MAETVKLGPWGAPGGEPRDVNRGSMPQRLKNITISWDSDNRSIIGLSFSYEDQDGVVIPVGPWGRTIDQDHSDIINIGQGEKLDLISGTFNNSEGITSLMLTTNQNIKGPYGSAQGPAFSVPLRAGAGEVVAFFGQVKSVTFANDTLSALGVYVLGKNGLPIMIGPWGDNGLNQYINTPIQLKSVTVYSTQRINGLSFTYDNLDNKPIDVGPWGNFSGQKDTLSMSGQYVNNITGSFNANGVTSLQFTTNTGERRRYGRISGTNFSVPLPDEAVVGNNNRNGAVLGFFGRSGPDGLVALGVYIGVAPQP